VTVPREEVRGWGGLRRSGPTGGCANGIPLKLSTLPAVEPTIVAPGLEMVTIGPLARSIGAARAMGRMVKIKRRSCMLKDLNPL
jgi:hypothetical protein